MKPSSKVESRIATIDYKNVDNWFLEDLQNNNKEADVFYIHPTTYITGKKWNQDLSNEAVNRKTIDLPIRYQASVFFDEFNVFIPKYKQAAFYAFLDQKGEGKVALDIAYKDVKKSFLHYYNSLRKGKPFIIAGHSQGSFHALRLLKELKEDNIDLSDLVCAYLIGWPIKQAEIRDVIEVCEDAEQRNCLVSWNTESVRRGFSIVREVGKDEKVVCVNPLSWSTDTTYCSKEMNKGALHPNYKKNKDELILYYCDAKINNGSLEINKPYNQRKLQMPMGKRVYHIYDYNFFYQNLKINAVERLNAYLLKKNEINGS